jgi:hypothetical protein
LNLFDWDVTSIFLQWGPKKSILEEVNPARQIPSAAPSASRKSNTSALTNIEPLPREFNDLMYQYPLVI